MGAVAKAAVLKQNKGEGSVSEVWQKYNRVMLNLSIRLKSLGKKNKGLFPSFPPSTVCGVTQPSSLY